MNGFAAAAAAGEAVGCVHVVNWPPDWLAHTPPFATLNWPPVGGPNWLPEAGTTPPSWL